MYNMIDFLLANVFEFLQEQNKLKLFLFGQRGALPVFHDV